MIRITLEIFSFLIMKKLLNRQYHHHFIHHLHPHCHLHHRLPLQPKQRMLELAVAEIISTLTDLEIDEFVVRVTRPIFFAYHT